MPGDPADLWWDRAPSCPVWVPPTTPVLERPSLSRCRLKAPLALFPSSRRSVFHFSSITWSLPWSEKWRQK